MTAVAVGLVEQDDVLAEIGRFLRESTGAGEIPDELLHLAYAIDALAREAMPKPAISSAGSPIASGWLARLVAALGSGRTKAPAQLSRTCERACRRQGFSWLVDE